MERCRGLVSNITCNLSRGLVPMFFLWILTMTMTVGPSFSRALHFATMTRYWSIHAELSCRLFAPTNFPPFRTTPSRHFRTPFLLSFLDSIVDDDRRPSTTDPSTCPFNQTMTSHGDGRQWQHQPMTKSTALSTACPAGLSSVKMYLDT